MPRDFIQNHIIRNYIDFFLKENKPEKELPTLHCNSLFYRIQEVNTNNICY